ncbi:hypothetical protein ACFC6L_21555 [Kitasatospora phosalacinea]|uniref:hypothetical protein n=1 Tax=Kitasatospora phosalacinea TaxID=2065 RepID=UPI0035D60DD9
MTHKADQRTSERQFPETTASEERPRRHRWLPIRDKLVTVSQDEREKEEIRRAAEPDTATFEDLKRQYLDKSVVTHGERSLWGGDPHTRGTLHTWAGADLSSGPSPFPAPAAPAAPAGHLAIRRP